MNFGTSTHVDSRLWWHVTQPILSITGIRSRPVWTADPESAVRNNKIRSWVASADAMYEKYSSPPAPIDFGKAKTTIRDKGLIEGLESFYKTAQLPVESQTMPESEIIYAEQRIKYLGELHELHKEYIPVIEAEIDFQQKNFTTAETTLFDMEVNYPLIHEEIEDELEKREWFKDTGYGGSGNVEAAH